ncbi:hypothetical protein, partial [Nonomuraea sp. NPDC050783]|uniref:CdiA C-terminal domain-containing protein n=1 Tax=Nonomuraea sp. NPDC050783 TaxID=3154634 RepID=UPI003466EBA3
LEHMRPSPADGATVRDERSRTFKFAGGAPLLITNCAVGCGNPVLVTAWSVDSRDHQKSVPVDGTRLAALDNGNRQYNVLGGVPDPADACPGGSGCDRAVAVNQYSVDHLLLDGTRVKDEGSSGQAAIVGGARVAFQSMEELNGAGYGDKPMLVIPNRLWKQLTTRIADGTRIKNAGSTTQAAIVGGARVPFQSMEELNGAGYGDKPMQVIPARVYEALPTRIADGTFIRKPNAPQIGMVVTGGRVTFPTADDLRRNGHGDKPILTVPARVFDAMPPVGYIDETESQFDSPPNRDPDQERRVAELLKSEGRYVKAIPSTNTERRPDALIDGTFPLEFKLVTTDNPSTVKRQIESAQGQSANVLVDTRGYGATRETALQGRQMFFDYNPNHTMNYIRIVGDGFDILWTRS